MSDTNELDRLRADLGAMQRVLQIINLDRPLGDYLDKMRSIESRIARLEAEADPWRKAKSAVEYFRGFADHKRAEHNVVAYIDHLEAENAKLKAENESFKSCEIDENGHFVRNLSEAEPHADEKGHIVIPDDSDKEPDLFAGTKATASEWYDLPHPCVESSVAFYVRHLEADNAKQAAKIVALENDLKGETLAGQIIRDDLKARIAELEARPVPPLDPKRVIATACKIIAKGSGETTAAFLMQYYQAGDAGIYPLAGDEPSPPKPYLA